MSQLEYNAIATEEMSNKDDETFLFGIKRGKFGFFAIFIKNFQVSCFLERFDRDDVGHDVQCRSFPKKLR